MSAAGGAAPILSATSWVTNAHMIADCAALGYLAQDWRTLDPTYGRGLWWTVFCPDDLTTHDIRQDGVDFRQLPHSDDAFQAVAFDPPYVAMGGRTTSGVPEQMDRYGMEDAPRTPAGVQQLVNDGLAECARVLEPGGFLLAKCQDYVSSGHLWPGSYYTTTAGLVLGLRLHDRLDHISGTRPQPPGRRQVHARRNATTLLVFRKPPRRG